MNLIKNHYLIFICIFLVFTIKGVVTLDPDFGWHLRYGEIILKEGFPKNDTFSYTMPSYNYANHEWLADVFIALTYPKIGIIGLAIIFSIIATFSIFLLTPRQINKFSLIPILLGTVALFSFGGIRPQVLTWLFFSILLKILLDEKVFQKFKWILPLIFIFWANIHGGFILGIMLLILKITLNLFTKRNIEISNLLIILLSIFSTFINPYGGFLFYETLNIISSLALKFSIAEWIPGIFILDFAILTLAALSAIFVFMYRKKFTLLELLCYFGLLVLAASGARHIPLWILISIPITACAINWFYQDVKTSKDALLRFDKAYKIFLILIFSIVIFQTTISFSQANSLSEKSYYPSKAIEILKNNLPEKTIFSEYNWGGYLVWKLPEKKVFVDGRMPTWRQNNIKHNESENAFEEYNNLVSGKIKFEEAVKKYDIDTVLLMSPKQNDKSNLVGEISLLIQKIFNQTGENKPREDIITQIKKSGWKEVYKDNIAVIYHLK